MPFHLRTVGISLAALGGLYAVILGALLTPDLQRFALYAHKLNTLFIHDIDEPEEFGFAQNQVTPFNIQTPDGETLYAWHILPVDVYACNEYDVINGKNSYDPAEDFTKSKAYRLLTTGDSKVVVSCLLQEVHGNAGHVAQGWRPDTYRYLTTHPSTHVVTIDYRGFGKSTGHPTEAGLITDGTALVNWVMSVANIPPERIVILGQSLGTAVSSAVALRFADPTNELNPKETRATPPGKDAIQTTSFAGVILVAPFYSLPSLMLTYRIGGFLPILLPLRPFPRIASYLTSQVEDQWPTAERLAAYYLVSPALWKGQNRSMGTLQVLHATNDFDISYHQTQMICRRMLEGRNGCKAPIQNMNEEDRPRVRFEILNHGGHNKVITYSSVAAAVVRAFDDVWEPNFMLLPSPDFTDRKRR